MKTFRELFFKASPERLGRFIDEIQNFATGNWSVKIVDKPGRQWIEFNYRGNRVDQAAVFISIGKCLNEGELRVNNIVPLEKNQLSIDEYNNVLELFYGEIIKPYKERHFDIEISPLTDDIFDPRTVISEEALKKLRTFCGAANKSTGSSHPSDQEKWFDFICQTVDDDRIFDIETLAKFLQDESYWGKREEGFLGAIGSFAWDEKHAWQLASEYEDACAILQYYKRTRGY